MEPKSTELHNRTKNKFTDYYTKANSNQLN